MAQQTPTDRARQPDTLAHELKETATTQLEKLAGKAADQFNDIAGQAESAVSQVADRGREVGERVQEAAQNFKGSVDRSIKNQPLATLAVAAVMGFVLGALWKS